MVSPLQDVMEAKQRLTFDSAHYCSGHLIP
jgi:hypothetical protein